MTEFAMTPVGDITEGPNVRSKLGDLTELAASLSSTGMLEPVTVRPKGNGLELVFGFRRFRAAKLAKLGEVPTLTRELTDDEVLEVQLTENVQRLDMDPIDEALGYQQLVSHDRTIPEIAGKMGRPPAYIAQRLRLCSLSEKCSEALHEEQISLGIALLIAKLPTAALQDKALEEVGPSFPGEAPMTVAEAKTTIEREVMRDLAAAPFDRVSLELVAAAGSCSACPKRTGAQAVLFGDDTSPDLCTDPVCFRSKLDAHWSLRQEAAKSDGVEVLSKKKAEEALHNYAGGQSGFRKLDDTVYIGNKKKTVKQLLGKGTAPAAIARDERSGAIVELAPSAEVEAAIKAAKKASGDKDDDREGPSNYQKAEAEKRKVEKARRTALTELLVGTVETKCKKATPVELLQGLVFGAIESTWNETHKAIVSRRKLETDEDKKKRVAPDVLLRQWVTLNPRDYGSLLGLLTELLVGRGNSFDATDENDDDFGLFGAGIWALEALGIDVEAVDAKKAKAAKPTKPTKKAPKAASSKAKPAAKKKAPKKGAKKKRGKR